MARRLGDALTAKGLHASVTPRLAALPTVTPTAKPAVTPIGGLLGTGSGFDPRVSETGQKWSIDVMRKLLTDGGFQILMRDDAMGDPTGAAWTERGEIDGYGHAQGWKLARRVMEEVGELAERVAALLDAGWREVRVITDHGWLLLPGGLPKTELPEHLTDVRKRRCARLKPGVRFEGQTMPWHWDQDVRIALAPGIGCFEAGKEYEHGGLSPQECVVPVVTVRAGVDPVWWTVPC